MCREKNATTFPLTADEESAAAFMSIPGECRKLSDHCRLILKMYHKEYKVFRKAGRDEVI